MNIIRTPIGIDETNSYLKMKFEMKDLDKTKLCLSFLIKHLSKEIFVHQSSYIEKILKRFIMDKAYLVSTPIVVRSLENKKDSFQEKEKGEELLGPEVPCLSIIDAFMYFANCTCHDIVFSLIYWQDIVMLQLEDYCPTMDMSLFYVKDSKAKLIGYVDVEY